MMKVGTDKDTNLHFCITADNHGAESGNIMKVVEVWISELIWDSEVSEESNMTPRL